MHPTLTLPSTISLQQATQLIIGQVHDLDNSDLNYDTSNADSQAILHTVDTCVGSAQPGKPAQLHTNEKAERVKDMHKHSTLDVEKLDTGYHHLGVSDT